MQSDRQHQQTRFRFEKGQGILEYSLVGGLLLLIIIAIVAVLGPDIRAWWASRKDAQESLNQKNIVFEINETGIFTETVATETVPINNCGSSSTTQLDVHRSPRFSYQYELEEDFGPEVNQVLIQQLEDHYGVQNGEIKESNLNLRLNVPTNTRIDYSLVRQDLWKEGVILAALPDGNQISIPYRFRYDEKILTKNQTSYSCSP